MVEKKSFLPPGWQRLLLGTVLAALAGNILVRLIPWPERWMISYGEVQTAERMSRSYYLALTLAAAPMMEEAVFRLGIYGLLRRKLRPKAAAFLSALAFGFYHGNMIQGIYAFLLGFVLAWVEICGQVLDVYLELSLDLYQKREVHFSEIWDCFLSAFVNLLN